MRTIWEGFDFSYLLEMLQSVIPALICITLHELCHGLTAYWLGDDTAKRAGRLTLNPLRHLDPMGLLMLVVFRFGWAKPVPVNMHRFQNPRQGMAVTALAGPVSNVLLSLICLFLFGLLHLPLSAGGAGRYILEMLQTTAILSLGFAVFNILPIPPLDGSKVLFSVIGDESYLKLMRYERYGMILLVALVMFGAFNGILGPAVEAVSGFVMNLVMPLAAKILHVSI